MRNTTAARIKNYYSIAAAAQFEIENAERWMIEQPENALHFEKFKAQFQQMRSDAFVKVYILESLVSRGIC